MTLRPPPSPTGRQHPAFFDTECYPNYWLLKFRPLGGATRSYSLLDGERFTVEQAREIMSLFDGYCCVGFYSKGYDQWMIGAALAYYTPAELKVLNDTMIVQRVKPWEIPDLPRWEPADHVDIMEVAPGAGSQKVYAGRIHAKRMRDLPYTPDTVLDAEQIAEVDSYCGNDLDVLEHLYRECEPLLSLREVLSARYGIDLRSKSDTQLAAAVIKQQCEQAAGRRIYKPHIVGQSIRYRSPSFVTFSSAELQHAHQVIRDATFYADAGGQILIPPQLEKLTINLGRSSYKIGIGGLHSQEKCVRYVSDEHMQLRAPDVASYYPSLILNSGEWPPALGETFRQVYADIKAERLAAKARQEAGDESARPMNEGGKIMINGCFGLTGNVYSVLYAPGMLLQTTMTGQLSLLMLIEWHEHYGIPVVSANTDGLVIACPRHLLDTSNALIAEWERRTGLTMENTDWQSLYARDVNNYFAVDAKGKVKRKGEYSKAGLVAKKNPDVEICSDAVAALLASQMPVEATIFACNDIRKFVTMQVVTGGGIKLWGDGPRKTDKVRDMVPRLEAHGWSKQGRGWVHPVLAAFPLSASEAYGHTFPPQRPEFLGKVVRWYYGTQSPGPIVYAARNAVVSLSYGAQPCMELPDTLPSDIDYQWYIDKANDILNDVGYRA